MAEDLGKIDIGVEIIDKKDDGVETKTPRAGGAGGNQGGSISDMVAGFNRGGFIGGARGAGLVKLAAKAALVVGSFIALKKIIGGVVGTYKKWTAQIEQTIDRFSYLNATMAAAAAHRKISQISRDIKSARVLAKPVSKISKTQESMKDAFRPLQDMFILFKGFVVTMLQPVVVLFTKAIISLIRFLAGASKGGIFKTASGLAVDYVAWLTKGFQGIVLGYEGAKRPRRAIDIAKPFIKMQLNEKLDALDKSLNEILEELERGNDDRNVEVINKTMGEVGIHLTNNQWNPWKTKEDNTSGVTQ